MLNSDVFPDIIKNLPEAEILDGVTGYLFQGKSQQIVFMEFKKDIEIPPHSHDAQWGVVLAGEIEFVIGNINKQLKKGDSYYIPEGVVHSAKIKKGYKDVTLFNQVNRYKKK